MCEKDSICSCLTDQNDNCTCDKRDPAEDMTCPTSEPPSIKTPGWLHIITSGKNHFHEMNGDVGMAGMAGWK